LFDLPFDQGGYTSFLLVSGLVVNGMILLVSDYKRFQKKQRLRCGRALFRKALSHKFTPIVLTILSTIVGLIPFMLYGQEEVFWYALAAGTIGGLSFSVFLLLFVIPLFFVKRGRDAAMIP
jgi:multidrug efflux pump subunit AcrB